MLAGLSAVDASRHLNQASAQSFAAALSGGKAEAFAQAIAQASGIGTKAAAQAIAQAVSSGKSEAVSSALASSATKGGTLSAPLLLHNRSQSCSPCRLSIFPCSPIVI